MSRHVTALARSAGPSVPGWPTSERSSLHAKLALLGVSTLLFVASAAVTVVWGRSMSAMGSMEMPGGWTMSMVWMRMPGQSWLGAAASFVGMWTVMMVAMMLPSLVPVLWRYRESVGRDSLTTIVGAGYFTMWAVFGAALFPPGVALAEVAMREPGLARLVPVGAGVVVLFAGFFQFTAWKLRRLACCREEHWCGVARAASAGAAWWHGVRLAAHCGGCSAGLTASLLVLGVMDLRAMAMVAVASSAERLAPDGERVAWVIGLAAVGIGLFGIVRAAAAG